MTKEEKYNLVKSRLKNLRLDVSEEQLDFILHPLISPCFLKACPGSGKTEVVGLKAAYEIAAWQPNFSGLAVLSFTKTAAKEISNRVTKYDGINAARHPHYIGTIDAWLHGYILHPFGYKIAEFEGTKIASQKVGKIIGNKSFSILESGSNSPFLENYRHNYRVIETNDAGEQNEVSKQIQVDEYYLTYDGKVEMNNKDRTVPVSEETQLIAKKKKFLKSGFATYQDAEYLCYKVLEISAIAKNISKRFPFIIVDECQDLSQSQIRLFHLLAKEGTIFHFVGDITQAIFDFKRVCIDKIEGFMRYYKFTEKFLTLNFRSNQEVVNVCLKLEELHYQKPPNNIEAKEIDHLTSCCVLWEYDKTRMQDLPQQFLTYVEQKRKEAEKKGVKINFDKCAILARGHTILSEFQPQPQKGHSKTELLANALDCWNTNPRTGDNMRNALQQLGKCISLLAYEGKGNHQHQYCPEGIGQVEWRNFLFVLITDASLAERKLFPFLELNWSAWAKILKPYLELYWNKLPITGKEWDKVKGSVMSPQDKATEFVKKTMIGKNSALSNRMRFTTIHDVKGETLDAVMLVSSKDRRSSGGHFEHWLDPAGEKERIRFAYVASSRPKHILIWAIPKIQDNAFLTRITALGLITNLPPEAVVRNGLDLSSSPIEQPILKKKRASKKALKES